MRAKSLAIFWTTAVLTGAGVWSIHNTQVEERERLHSGVIRDEALYRVKKRALLAGELTPAAAATVPQRQ
ncbi:PET117 mitochondrial [Micractinium conductrix]|uniref:PET117 mitochondrial n=1 Tax=Micractinium conductrix TaxID=554055 RepID=A0A2P6VJY2_9CHLO|nr:PET117 mitochondrial [Micractinium conductrix]|eukprot:PSC74402.1 PET117 mitochondrial [Micractinium conductrix]